MGGLYNVTLEKNIALYFKEDDINTAIENIKSLQPAEVSVFYDLNGKIIIQELVLIKKRFGLIP